MADYSIEIQTALAYIFPEAAIKGYWFLYTNDVLAFVKQNSLQNQLARNHGSSALRMLLVLPLLPAEYMKPGLDAVRKWAREKHLPSAMAFEQCCTYVEQSWLRKIGAGRMSIFGLPHGVYNHLQTFNREVKGLLNTTSPLIWTVLECITQIATRTYVKCNKKLTENKPKPVSKSQQELDTIIKNATQMWIRSPVHLRNPLQFLQLASHCINETVYFESISDESLGAGGSMLMIGDQTAAADCRLPKLVRTISYEPRDSIRESMPTLPNKHGPTTTATTTTTVPATNNCTNSHIGHVSNASEPPPLAYFPKKQTAQRPILFTATEPPPLVPIQRRPKS